MSDGCIRRLFIARNRILKYREIGLGIACPIAFPLRRGQPVDDTVHVRVAEVRVLLQVADVVNMCPFHAADEHRRIISSAALLFHRYNIFLNGPDQYRDIILPAMPAVDIGRDGLRTGVPRPAGHAHQGTVHHHAPVSLHTQRYEPFSQGIGNAEVVMGMERDLDPPVQYGIDLHKYPLQVIQVHGPKRVHDRERIRHDLIDLSKHLRPLMHDIPHGVHHLGLAIKPLTHYFSQYQSPDYLVETRFKYETHHHSDCRHLFHIIYQKGD